MVQDIMTELKDTKDLADCLQLLRKLNQLENSNNKKEIISTLQQSKEKAPLEISMLEFTQGDTYLIPWKNFSNLELHRKLIQYRQGLQLHCANKMDQTAFDEYISNHDS